MGKRPSDEAASLIAEDYLAATSLAGDEGYVRDRVLAHRDDGVTCLSAIPSAPTPWPLLEKTTTWLA